ncbi:Gfo/Idh/MocA family protein [Planctomyces sp. SH-PL14]|uniref:Gfo/Idh/MocA family protein n=1 Tax=Planctomyces sp. SH-PL14 TaxID=1632864 RepID=UPI00078EF771|nr:Gfo/Idh/MocA family oxidoreductase [Planctomyces sp. SH-PL14]AMV19918.1 Glucose--fructose oxidoreductase precursor [Planctomyces sp. SH-PL14]
MSSDSAAPAPAAAPAPFRFVGINFDHMHMGDLLRKVHEHPGAEIAGICDADPARMQKVIENFQIPPERVFTDVKTCLKAVKPDAAILCPATGRHAEYVELVAPHKVHLLVEKPFAASLKHADRMIAAAKANKVRMAINWPIRWSPCHVTAHRLVSEGLIGQLEEVHHYGGNRGPLWHSADKVELTPTDAMKRKSWFYKKGEGGGSLLDYLGYGATFATWYHGGKKPLEVTAVTHGSAGLEVDEHSIVVCRYKVGLSKLETRWGTFTDPWTHQPQPKCGFILKGTAGTISSFDYSETLRVQTAECPEGRDVPVDVLEAPFRNPIEYFVHAVRNKVPFEGPLSPKISRVGQQIVDTAVKSAEKKKTIKLLE